MRPLLPRILAVAGVALAAALFAAANGGQRVTLRLGIVTLRGVPLSTVVLGAILFGMALTLLAGLRGDLRTRRMLLRYRRALGEEEAGDEELGVGVQDGPLPGHAPALREPKTVGSREGRTREKRSDA